MQDFYVNELDFTDAYWVICSWILRLPKFQGMPNNSLALCYYFMLVVSLLAGSINMFPCRVPVGTHSADSDNHRTLYGGSSRRCFISA